MFQQNRAKIGYEMLTSFPHKEGGKQWAPVEHKDNKPTPKQSSKDWKPRAELLLQLHEGKTERIIIEFPPDLVELDDKDRFLAYVVSHLEARRKLISPEFIESLLHLEPSAD